MMYRHPGHQQMSRDVTVNRTVSNESRESHWVDDIMEVLDEVKQSTLPKIHLL